MGLDKKHTLNTARFTEVASIGVFVMVIVELNMILKRFTKFNVGGHLLKYLILTKP